MSRSDSTQPRWEYGDMYATPPLLHRCLRCGAERANIDLHDEWHDALNEEPLSMSKPMEQVLYEHRENGLTCYDHPDSYCCPCGEHEVRSHRKHLADVLTRGWESEWGVRFPSGSVQSYGSDEAEARRYALATSTLRPDLPTLVVRQVITPWEVAS